MQASKAADEHYCKSYQASPKLVFKKKYPKNQTPKTAYQQTLLAA